MRSCRLSEAHDPLTELYAHITDEAPASIAVLKWGRKSSWRVASSHWTSTSNLAFSMELRAKCLTHGMAFGLTPRARAAPMRPRSTVWSE